MAAQQFAREEKIARSRAALYKTYVEDEAWQRAVRRGAQETHKKHTLEALEALAWHLHTGGPGDKQNVIEVLQNEKYGFTNDELRAIELLTLVREKIGIVVFVDQKLVFSHTTFQEYFVAKRLHRAWQKNVKLTWKFLRPRLHLTAWREPLLLFASQLADAIEIIDLITMINHAKSRYENKLHRD
jgi:hypothetical protein